MPHQETEDNGRMEQPVFIRRFTYMQAVSLLSSIPLLSRSTYYIQSDLSK